MPGSLIRRVAQGELPRITDLFSTELDIRESDDELRSGTRPDRRRKWWPLRDEHFGAANAFHAILYNDKSKSAPGRTSWQGSAG